MLLSSLQKYILIRGLDLKGKKFSRDKLVRFYEEQHQKTKIWQRVKIITRSLERLIDKELLIGYGTRTPHKWYIKKIKLTSKGRKAAKKLLGEQQMLPFKLKTKNSKCKDTTKN